MKALGVFVAATLAAVTMGQNSCDPGVCKGVPGLVYNADLDQCAWADEMGCELKDLGFNTDCSGLGSFELKALDFDLGAALPEGMTPDNYFLVCVPSATEEDRALEAQVKSAFPHLQGRGLVQPTGPILPRLLCCPEGSKFNQQTLVCDHAIKEDNTLTEI